MLTQIQVRIACLHTLTSIPKNEVQDVQVLGAEHVPVPATVITAHSKEGGFASSEECVTKSKSEGVEMMQAVGWTWSPLQTAMRECLQAVRSVLQMYKK